MSALNTKVAAWLGCIGLVVVVAGCPPKPAGPSASNNTSATANQPAGGENKTHGHGDEHTGTPNKLGEIEIGGIKVSVVQRGELAPKTEAIFELEVAGTVKAVRGWIGKEDKSGSTVAKAEKEQDDWDLHIEGMAEIPAGAKLWIELENADGSKAVGSVSPKLK